MSSRMEKYSSLSVDNMSRTKRNQNIYSSTDMSELSRIKTNTNVSVISDAPKEIDLEKIRNYVNSLNDDNDEKSKRVSLELPKEEEIVVQRREEKDYDINSVLERARDKRETDYEEDRHRKLNSTQIDILKNIKIKNDVIEEAKDPDITEPIEELNTEEKTIVELIQDIQNNSENSNKKDLFDDLMADNDDTVVMAPIEEETNKENIKDILLDITQDLESIKQPANDFTHEINLEKEALKQLSEEDINNEDEEDTPKVTEVDKSFYSNSMTFNKSDFEALDDIEKDVKKSGIATKVAITGIILLLIVTILLILNFVFDFNIL